MTRLFLSSVPVFWIFVKLELSLGGDPGGVGVQGKHFPYCSSVSLGASSSVSLGASVQSVSVTASAISMVSTVSVTSTSSGATGSGTSVVSVVFYQFYSFCRFCILYGFYCFCSFCVFYRFYGFCSFCVFYRLCGAVVSESVTGSKTSVASMSSVFLGLLYLLLLLKLL